MDERDYFKMVLTAIFMLFLSLLLLLGLCTSCTTIKYVPVETTKMDSIYINKVERDSIYLQDSIYIKEKGDTIFEYRYKYLFKEIEKVDTFYVERTDTISTIVEVEKALTKWQRFKLDLGGIALGGIVVLIIGIIFALIRKR